MANEKWESLKRGARQVSDAMGLTDPKSHWIPIAKEEYDQMHPAVRMKREDRQGDRAEHLKQFNLTAGSNVVSINVARENRHLKSLRGE